MSYLISIIIPVYNGERYIQNGLKSIINQSIGFENLEVILVNDNSTDSTLKILEKYEKKNENIRIINLPKNHQHPGVPRNIGIKHASAEYIMFMDQDDWFEPRSCEILYNKITKENMDIVSGRWYKFIDDTKIPFRPLESEIKINNIREDPSLLGHPAFIWVKIFRKSLLRENNIYFPETGIEDVVFTSHAFLKAKGIIMLKDDYVYTHYVNPNSISRSKSKYYLKQLFIGYRNAYEIFKKNGYIDYYKYLINMRLTYFLNTVIRSELSKNETLEILKEFQEFYRKVKKLGAKPGPRLELLFNLIETNQLENAELLIDKLNKMDSLGRKNKILKNKNKILKNRNKYLNNKIREISPLKGYIRYKIANIKKNK